MREGARVDTTCFDVTYLLQDFIVQLPEDTREAVEVTETSNS